MVEPILDPSGNRYVLFPIKYSNVWDMYKKAVASFWTVEEISFSDMEDWNKLTPNEQNFIENTLAFFAGSDGIVNENLVTRFYNDVQIPEAKAFYTFQMAIESVHSECYSLLIDTYIQDAEKKNRLFNAIDHNPTIKRKADWAIKWIQSAESFATRLIGFAIVEGIFFSGAFASIYYIKEKGLLHSLTFSNELISRDESLHTEFAIMLYNLLENKLSEEEVHSIFSEAVELEIEFIVNTLQCGLLGINAELMSEYVKFVADRLLVQLNYKKMYNIRNCPLDFMERISITNKSNFFEVRVAEYSKATIDKTNLNFTFTENDDDF
uniref:ribonucleoside-diphosphate reductase n=1 Tax=Pyramimonas orientalis virus TaxID=455367 RepID=A0A7M3UNU6_POV01|nr:ribonucleoside-diphosphate reductase small chain [Pyramimonas orientalis virus]